MRRCRAVVLPLVLGLVAAGVQAQQPVILLSNAENLELHYLIDPPGLTGPDTSSAVFVGRVVSFLSENAPVVPFRRLAPLGLERVEGLTEGIHVLVGVYLPRGAAEVPVRVLRIQAGGGIAERLYTVYREPATALVKAGIGRLGTLTTPEQAATTSGGTQSVASGGEAGGAAAVSGPAPLTGFWSTVEPVVTFTGAFEPEVVVRQTGQGSTIIPLGRSSFWGVDGVRLRELRIARRSSELAFRIQTFGTMSPQESLLLYLQEDRGTGQDNSMTLEMQPVADLGGGYVVLWRKGVSRPVIVGRFVQRGNVLIGRVLYADAEPYVDLAAEDSELTFDVCTAHHEPDRGVYEEYYHATVRLDRLPRVTDEGTLFL